MRSVALLLLSASAAAQGPPPMAVDPSRMSGIPRPDPDTPAGTIVVRLIRGELANRVTGHAVALDGPGGPRTAQTDDQGRAAFTGLVPGGPYVAQASLSGEDLASQPIELPPAPGVRVMLVFKLDRETAPPPIPLLPPVRDPSAISIGRRSHVIAQVRDDVVEVMENFLFENAGGAPFDPGPDGIKLPLPDGAEGAQPGPEMPGSLSVAGRIATWKGNLPPGDTAVSIVFVIPQRGHAVSIRQTVPFPLEQLMLITDRYPGMKIEGPGLHLVERSMGGREFWVVSGPKIPAGGAIDVRLAELPHRPTWDRDLAVAIAALIACAGLVSSLRGARNPARDRPRP